MTALERLMKAWDKADRATRIEFLTFLDQWQEMRRDEVDCEKAQLRAERDR